jgi:hypothetical protein
MLVSQTRFFDIDEFSYMHWAAAVAHGEHLYTGIFSYFTPGFFWLFSLIFLIMGKTAQVLVVGRMVSFIIFLSILSALSYLWGITRGWKWALLPAVILAFLPMPYDKFLEIRPDNLSALLALIGVIGEIRGLQTKNTNWWLVSGLFYSASLFVLAKTVPIVAVGAGIAVLYAISSKSLKSLKILMLGLVGPWVLFFLGSAIVGNLGVVWYSLTRLPFEVYKSTAGWSMEADLFFFPNASFYGGTGYTITSGLIVNHLLWILAVIVGVYRLFTSDKKQFLVELFISLVFFVQIFGYVKYFPAKHSQYLIPIAVFVAYFAADGLSAAFDRIGKLGGMATLIIVLIGFGYGLGNVNYDVNASKLTATNINQITELNRLIQTVPSSARVVDLEGRMFFWADGYPVSSLPIDQTIEFVSRRPQPLSQYLTVHPAQFVWDGDSGRLATLTSDNQTFIRDTYISVSGWNNKLYALRRLQ